MVKSRFMTVFMAAWMCAVVIAGQARAQVALDLRDADLQRFVEIVSQTTGRNFILDPEINGTVTVLAPNDVPPEAIYEIFLNVLELNRLTIVEGISSDRIVPSASPANLRPGNRRA